MARQTQFRRATAYLPALDGLRFLAATTVVVAHYYVNMFGEAANSDAIRSLSGLGMTLFFVLSGFVIHYNYQSVLLRPGGLRTFLVARFARLYPLYTVLLAVDFTYTFITAHSACGRVGASGAEFFGLLYYITFTQDWFYGTICGSSLVYQYGPVAAVSWSISIEAFFYVVYVIIGPRIARKKLQPKTVICLTALAYVAAVLYFLACGAFEAQIDTIGVKAFGPIASVQHGYQDSLLRWLIYFNPLARVPEFMAGVAAAHLYLSTRSGPSSITPALRDSVTAAAIAALVIVHLWLYVMLAPGNSFVGRIASPLYSPLVATMMYCIVQYQNTWCSQLFATPVLVRWGEASYSIYLLHAILPRIVSRLGFDNAGATVKWMIWMAAVGVLISLSRMSYVHFERPARLAIRQTLAP